MKLHTTLALFAAALATACAQPTPEQQVVNDAATALGGRDKILAVKTLVLEGEGTNGNLGQDMTMDATGQAFQLSGYKRSIDVVGAKARTEQTRTGRLRPEPRHAPRPLGTRCLHLWGRLGRCRARTLDPAFLVGRSGPVESTRAHTPESRFDPIG